MDVKTAVNKALEEARVAGIIGGSLEAEVTLYADDGLLQQLGQLGDELRFVLITSAATLAPLAAAGEAAATELTGLRVQVEKSEHRKCERCWHRRADVGATQQHPELCGRCVDNVQGSGEQRRFA